MYFFKKFLVVAITLLIAQSVFANNYFVVNTKSNQQKPLANQPETAKTVEIDGLPDAVLKAAINAYRLAVHHHDAKNLHVLTIVDFDRPSYQKRLWVIDLHNDHLIMTVHVAQGENTGKVYARRFSNDPGSRESSLGVFTTVGDQYVGEYGVALRLKGLEAGINNNAFFRGIVIHSDQEISPRFINAMGYAGQTWGCFAVNPDHIDRLVEMLQGGSVFFAYATPEKGDPLVTHHLSPGGRKMYNAIIKTNSNPFVHFFETL